MRKLLYLLAFCWLFSASLPAQPVNPLLLPLTVDQGLSRGNVQRLYLDREGFLWLGTSNGLNRFDATRNLLVRSDSHDLTDQSFNQIFEDYQQRLWAVSSNVGLFLLDKSSGKIDLVLDLAAQEQLDLPLLLDVQVESTEHLLLAINDQVYRYYLTSGKLQKLFSMPTTTDDNARIRQLWLSGQQLLIATNRGLFALNTQNGISNSVLLPKQPGTDSVIVNHVYPYQDQLYIASHNGLSSLPLQALQDTTQLGRKPCAQRCFGTENAGASGQTVTCQQSGFI